LHILNHQIKFPPVQSADADGLLAIGGDLNYERLLLAYQSGIFPWYDGDVILWWCPNPRFVLFPDELKISKSMKQVIKKKEFQFTINKSFELVIKNCKLKNREGQDGTWITNEMETAYINLHKKGIAISAETWSNNELVGGLYGLLIGKVFCGESMFANKSNASKFAFINLVKHLQTIGVQIIDCQIHTEHLESLGGRMIGLEEYLGYLK
jgi:leucyl/phenylalanyl-tRNA---protein transferase